MDKIVVQCKKTETKEACLTICKDFKECWPELVPSKEI